MIKLHVNAMKRKIFPHFTHIAELGAGTVTNRIRCRHLITDGDTKHWVMADLVDKAWHFTAVDGT